MKKSLIVFLSCFFVFSGVSLSYAKDMKSSGDVVKKEEKKKFKKNVIKNAARYIKFKEKLGLSEAQIKALEQIQYDFHKDSRKLSREIKSASMEYSRAYRRSAGIMDFKSARIKAKKASALSLHLKNLKINTYEKSYNVLTHKQKNKLSELQKKNPKKHKKIKKKVVKKKKPRKGMK